MPFYEYLKFNIENRNYNIISAVCDWSDEIPDNPNRI